jgi:ABC-type arginine transport system ATPase subunit
MTTGTLEMGVALDDGAGLGAVEPRHQDVAENQMRLVVVNLGERVEAVFRQKNLVPTLLQKNLGAAPDRVAVVNDKHFVT